MNSFYDSLKTIVEDDLLQSADTVPDRLRVSSRIGDARTKKLPKHGDSSGCVVGNSEVEAWDRPQTSKPIQSLNRTRWSRLESVGSSLRVARNGQRAQRDEPCDWSAESLNASDSLDTQQK
jgi:hypothetical protein